MYFAFPAFPHGDARPESQVTNFVEADDLAAAIELIDNLPLPGFYLPENWRQRVGIADAPAEEPAPEKAPRKTRGKAVSTGDAEGDPNMPVPGPNFDGETGPGTDGVD